MPHYKKMIDFKTEIERVRKEAQAPFKTQIMVHQFKKLLDMPKLETPQQKTQWKAQQEHESKIFSQGLEAVASIGESTFAVSTPKRFEKWAKEKGISQETDLDIDRKAWNKREPFVFGGKEFLPVEEFRQHGYGAWHIGSRIDEIRREGLEPFVVDARRNRRFLFKERKAELKDKIRGLV